MKNLFISLFLVIFIFILSSFSAQAQSNVCGSSNYQGDPNPDNFRGGWYKPSKSNIGGAPSNGYFPVLIVFVQFKNEPGDSTTTNFESWPAKRPPNYINKVIDTTIRVSANWWDAYGDFAISDYWHEFSRGKLHVYGNKLSIILPQEISWYETPGRGIEKVNKDIYETIKPLINNWPDYDRWKYVNDGEFVWENDGLIDMLYIVYRSRRDFLFDSSGYVGVATLGDCEGTINNRYTIDSNSTSVTRIYSSSYPIALGSGVRVFADSTSPYSRQQFLDKVTHEHGHYLFFFNHKPYAKMEGFSTVHEFSLSPWEVVKLGYIKQEIVNYSSPINYLYDYSSRGLNGPDTNEVLQVPISSDTTEFFLIANRRKESQWDRRMGGDTLAIDKWQYLKNVNPEYGKGFYIYHVKNGYNFGNTISQGDIDLVCADGLWSWVNTNTQRKRINNLVITDVIAKQYPVYNNDYPDSDDPGYTISRDEMSNGIIFTPGSPDNFSTNPIGRGTHTLYTNDNDYWYSLANSGDRWDGWNVGYNEVFSPYSSPNTKAMDNSSTGIFVWYQALEASTKKATLKIYRASEYGGTTPLDTILKYTPPSRPMGIKIENYHSINPLFCYPKVVWNHNNEPDMLRTGNVKQYKIYKATQPRMSIVPTEYSLFTTQNIHKDSIAYFVDLSVNKYDCSLTGLPPYGTQYPVRYYVKAVDKYDDESVPSDFASTVGVTNGGIDPIGPDNFISINPEIPKEFSLKQNYPNPFNPTTNIQYDLPSDNFVTIKIYDILGKEIMTLVNEFRNAGSYIISFNATNLSSGIYYYKIKAGSFQQVKKMIILK